jgi:hypothetical protein
MAVASGRMLLEASDWRPSASMKEMAVAKPIRGDWEELTRDLSRRVAADAPEWTDYADRDPGVTLVQLFAFLTESLLDRGSLSAKGRADLRDVLARLERADDVGCADGTLTRNRYFFGKLMSVADFEQEQSYLRTKHRRHNRLLHGVGIVRGLEVALENGQAGGGPVIVVSPGVAIASNGEELVVCEPVTIDVCSGPVVCYVTLTLAERSVDPTVEDQPTRVEESVEIGLSDDVPPGQLGIARLTLETGVWRLDPSFKPPRVA